MPGNWWHIQADLGGRAKVVIASDGPHHRPEMTTTLASEPRSRDQIAAATHIVRGALGDATLAVYLYGSAAAGGLHPHSDLDLLVISERSLSHQERAAIVQQLLGVSGRDAAREPARPLELTILARPSLIPWRYPPSLQLQYGEWMRPAFERREWPEWPHPDPDVTVLIESVRRAALPLFGPPATEMLEPVPRADLIRAMVDAIPVLIPGIEQGDDRRNGLLTLARIWMTLATGEIRSKAEAADWALSNLPDEQRPVLAHASAVYVGEKPEDWSELAGQLRPYVDHVTERIRRLAARS